MEKSGDDCSSCQHRRECLRGCSARMRAGGDGIFFAALGNGAKGFRVRNIGKERDDRAG